MRSLTPAPPADDDAALASALDTALIGRDGGLPGPDRSAALRARVLDAVAAVPDDAAPAPLHLRRRAGASRGLTAAAAVGALLLVGGLAVPGAVASAEARQVLTTTAERAVHTDALRPGPGQYVKEVTVTRFSVQAPLEGDAADIAVLGSTTYIPTEAGGLVVGVPSPATLFDGTVQPAPPSGGHPAEKTGLARAAELAGVARLEDLPRDPDTLVRHLRGRYAGGSASPDEDLYVQITDLLREPTLPADLRSGLVGALARVPDVRADEEVVLSDGRTGVGLRRAEPLRQGTVTETVLDPATGLIIGERLLNGTAFGELRWDTVIRETTVSATVVDSAPRPDVVEDP